MANYKNAIDVMKKMFNIDSFMALCSEDSISLSELLSLRRTVNCNGNCPDFYYYEWDEMDPSGPTIGSHEWDEAGFEQKKRLQNGNTAYYRDYYDRSTNTIKIESTSFDMPRPNEEYHYDDKLNNLVDSEGNECKNPELLKYYKCCLADVPYFAPITIANELVLDCEMNLYYSNQFLVSLESLNRIKPDDTEYQSAQELKSLLHLFRIGIQVLPEIYKKHLNNITR